MTRIRIVLAGLLGWMLLSGCGSGSWRQYRFTNPSEYYFYYPETETLRGPPALLIGLLGEGRSDLDCIELLHSFALDRKIAVLCPARQGGVALEDRLQAQTDLAEILGQIYSTHTFRNQFFLAGFGDAGTFALEYGLQYPAAVGGISAMSVEDFPDGPVPAGAPPVQLLVGSTDRQGLEKAQAQEQVWREAGLLIRVATVEGDGRSPSVGFARLASELIDQMIR